MRFDWYQATIEESPIWIRDALQDNGDGLEWADARPRLGAARCSELLNGGCAILELLEGGRYQHPHLLATGEEAHEAAALIRRTSPAHLVSRADVCEDLQAPGWFEHAFGAMVEIARERKVKPMREGDWDSNNPARTFYLGSPSSTVRVRCYEKGKQLRAEYGPSAAETISEDWVRLECQVRPAKRENKQLMAIIPAAEWWGAAGWSRQLARNLLDVDAPRLVVGTRHRQSDLERSEHYMVLQYGSFLAERARIEGSWEAAGEYYMRLYDKLRARGV